MKGVHQTWSRRPRFTLGQGMAVVVGVALLLGLAATASRRDERGLARAGLDFMLALPFAVAVLLALVASGRNQRLALGRFLGSAPMLGLAVVYFHLVCLGIVSVQYELPMRLSTPPQELAPLAIFPIAYFASVTALLPYRCPHCRSRSLERVTTVDSANRRYLCDECGVVSRQTDEKSWEIESFPTDAGLAVSASFAPKLRALRDELRPGRPH